MHIAIPRERLVTGLHAVQNIVSSRSTLPILANVSIKSGGENQLRFVATDLEATIAYDLKAEIKEPGATTLPAKKLFEIVRSLETPEVELKIDEKDVCSISAGASFFKIHGLSANDFPPFPQFQEDNPIELQQGKLFNALKHTSYAISNEQSRYILNGVYLHLNNQRLTVVATDGRRLALDEMDVEIPEDFEGKLIMPPRAVTELNRLLEPEGSLKVELKYSDKQAAFYLYDKDENPVISLITKLIEGKYPNYRQVIPEKNEEKVTLGREDFLQSLRRAEIMTSDKVNSVNLSLLENSVRLQANVPEVGEFKDSIAVNYTGGQINIAFNPHYMMEPLKSLNDDEVKLEITDDLSPGLLRGVNSRFLYVIMPLRYN